MTDFQDALTRLAARKGEELRRWSEQPLDRSAVGRFREAVGWPDQHEESIPPTVVANLFRDGIDIHVDQRPRETIDDVLVNPVNGGTEFFLYRQPKIGEGITARSILFDAYGRQGKAGELGFVVTETTYSDSDQNPIASLRVTMIYRGTSQ